MKRNTPSAVELSLQHDIAGDFAARAEGFLRFAIELSFHTAGVPEGENKLILPRPVTLFTGPKQ